MLPASIFFVLSTMLLISGCDDNTLSQSDDNGTSNNPLIEETAASDPTVVHLGGETLRSPAEVWSGGQFADTRDYIQFSRSWDAEKGLVRDEGVHTERISITLQGGFSGAPRNDGDQRLQELMCSRSGPEPTEDMRVQKYSSANGASDVFVISNLDESGRYPTAECGWHLCETSFLRRSGIRVNYRFSRQFVRNWVAIDQAVRAPVTSFELEK